MIHWHHLPHPTAMQSALVGHATQFLSVPVSVVPHPHDANWNCKVQGAREGVWGGLTVISFHIAVFCATSTDVSFIFRYWKDSAGPTLYVSFLAGSSPEDVKRGTSDCTHQSADGEYGHEEERTTRVYGVVWR